MVNYVDISEGRVNALVVPGLFTFIAGGILLLWHWTIGVGVMLFSLVLFFARSGVEIDLPRERCRTYLAFNKLKLGAWRSVRGFTAVHIKYYTDQPGYYCHTGTEMRIRTYDVHFVHSDGSTQVFYDFSSYANARRCAEVMANGWSWTLSDEIQERQQQAQAHAHDRN